MLNMISNTNAAVITQEQFLTDLTPEEASVIEGGKFVLIEKIQAIKADADFIGKDDTYITIGGRKIWGAKSFSTGQARTVNRGRTFGSSTVVALFDEDLGNDDPLGSFTVSGLTNGSIVRVSGSGSRYDVYYRVTA
ncbi:hypothetical protein LC605_20585 [Nostoc sp. CHAB 5836]|uniref:hypothetical protein n=1 Tax=Nostoc sp. CHAB 5836 TaxID=2780404 RepID=UPI001E2AEFD7|nr:hypothetical protein [Nostoc sp. CHAB 5836]MCC5617438.1 hypothetical protein [Nostoc sp. CHAB 5836]